MELLVALIKFIGLILFAGITIIGALCQVFDGLSGWFSARGAALLKPKNWKGKAAIVVVLLVLGTAAILLSVDMWKAMDKEPAIKSEAILLANAIEADVRRGVHDSNIAVRYRIQVETVIPRLLGSANNGAMDKLSKAYENMDVTASAYTNLAAHIRAAAFSLGKE